MPTVLFTTPRLHAAPEPCAAARFLLPGKRRRGPRCAAMRPTTGRKRRAAMLIFAVIACRHHVNV